MEQYVKGFKGFTPVEMCGLSPLASFYHGFNRLRVVPHFSSGIVELAKRERA